MHYMMWANVSPGLLQDSNLNYYQFVKLEKSTQVTNR